MPSKHARLSPSAAERWINCPPSVLLSEQFPDKSSVYAAEGTLAHSLAEIKVAQLLGLITEEEFEDQHESIKADKLYDKEMEQYTDEYALAIFNTYLELNLDWLYELVKADTEKRFNIDLGVGGSQCFGTADCVLATPEELHIYDFKYGKNVEVSAIDNSQLKLYALGALSAYDPDKTIKTIHLHIIQPRMNNFSDFTLTKDELLDWKNSIVTPNATLALSGKGEQAIGDWCLFCRAKPICRKQKEKYEFYNSNLPVPPYISNEEVGEMITKLEGAVAYQKVLKEYALNECLNGGIIPGYKAVEGRSNRKWTDQREAFETAQKEGGIEEAMLYERTPISLTAVEKLIGKKKFNDVLGCYVDKPEGKPTLVPESDKREAIGRKTAIEDFKDIEIKGEENE